MNYNDQLEDKRWLRKRNKILKRDNWICTACGSSKRLIVHHTYYLPLHPPPWAYPDDSLISLCWDCHKAYHEGHELTINSYHSDRKGRKPFKKPVLKKNQQFNNNKKKKNPPKLCLAELQTTRNHGETRYKPRKSQKQQ